MTTTTWIGTSWKMHKLLAEAKAFASRLRECPPPQGVQRFVIPSFPAIHTVAGALGPDSDVLVGAQNAHWEDAGAWTGEVSVPQVKDAGGRLVEIGHSERRTYFNETDATVNLKVRSVLRHGLIPLICVGEPDEVFRQGGSSEFIVRQAHAALDQVRDVSDVLIAYEPVWAIGETGRPANPEDIDSQFAALTEALAGRVRAILYGGSVSPGNAAKTLAVPGVDGLFVGRAAWDVEDYLALVDLAAQCRERAPAGATSTPTGHDGDQRRS
jgi:triosephosphate isomerase